MSAMIDLISVPSDAGAMNGTMLGPKALSDALSRALFAAGYGYHQVVHQDLADRTGFPKVEALHRPSRGKVKRKREVVAVANLTATVVGESLERDGFPTVLGGDHSIAMGSGRAALEFACKHRKRIGLLWIDAHYDAHTDKTTPSHNANGMPLATLLGYGARAFRPQKIAFLPAHVLHVGAGERDCEPEEKALLQELGVALVHASEFRRHNWALPWHALTAFLARVDLVWVSFDLDAVNRIYAPGVHLQSEHGLHKLTLLWLAQHVARSGKLLGLDIMEHKPGAEEYDEAGVGKTAMLASEFLLALLGKS